MAYCGPRPEIFGNYKGTDGLRLNDFPDLILEPHPFFKTYPARIVIRKTLSKQGHQYFSLVIDSVGQLIAQYLEERISKGETLSPESPLIPNDGYETRNFVGTDNIRWQITRAIITAQKQRKIRNRPYDLRNFFDSLLIAQNKGKIAPEFKAFFMGHKGTIENLYTTNRLSLSEALFKEIVDAFKTASEFFFDTPAEIKAQELLNQQEQQHQKEIEDFQKRQTDLRLELQQSQIRNLQQDRDTQKQIENLAKRLEDYRQESIRQSDFSSDLVMQNEERKRRRDEREIEEQEAEDRLTVKNPVLLTKEESIKRIAARKKEREASV